MADDLSLTPAHRRKLRRMRAIVLEAAKSDDPPSPEKVARAEAYLVKHASCEAFLLAEAAGKPPLFRPGCALVQGRQVKLGTHVETRTCPTCNKEKSVLSFDKELGVCIKCKYERPRAKDDEGKRKPTSKVQRVVSRKCPVCLKRVEVTLVLGAWRVEAHVVHRDGVENECAGSGRALFADRHDAMDHRVPGSFEGGKRR